MQSTRERILLAAERLFAAKGVAHATLKMVTQEADVNLAAVNYHFGSKESLVFAVFDDLADRISRRRLALLAARRLANGGKPLAVEEIVFFFMEPYVLHEGGRDGALLINMILHQRVSPTRTAERILEKYFDKVAYAFADAFAESIAHLDRKTLFWRYYFMVSSILFTASERGQGNRLAKLSGGDADLSNIEELVRQLTIFIAGGMVAPLGGKRVQLPPAFAVIANHADGAQKSRLKTASKPADITPETIKAKGRDDEQMGLRKRPSRSR